MTRTEMENYIEHMEEDGLVALCNDIYNWKYINGTLEKGCTLMNLSENIQYENVGDIEETVIRVSAKKLNKTVLLLLQTVPYMFLKTVK